MPYRRNACRRGIEDLKEMSRGKFSNVLSLFWVFFKIGLFTFGGGLAMISLISREVVENKKWITEKEMGDIVIVAESTPGAIAVNTATYVGFKIGGILGSIFATLGVVLPSLIIISAVYMFFGFFKANKWLAAAFKGIRAAVIVLLFNAAVKLFAPMDKKPVTIIAAAAVFLVSLFTNFGSIYLILAGGIIGVIWFVVKDLRTRRKNAATAGETSFDDRKSDNSLNAQNEANKGEEEGK